MHIDIRGATNNKKRILHLHNVKLKIRNGVRFTSILLCVMVQRVITIMTANFTNLGAITSEIKDTRCNQKTSFTCSR